MTSGVIKEETVEHTLIECRKYEAVRQECGLALRRILEELKEEE